MRPEIKNPYFDTPLGQQLLNAQGVPMAENPSPNIEKVTAAELPERLQEILVGPGYVKSNNEIEPTEQEDEPIVGAAAQEFTQEALRHPERYEYIANYIKSLADHFGLETPTVMDFGCGPGILTSLIAQTLPLAKVYGIDLSQDMLDLAAQNLERFEVEDSVKLYRQDVREVYKNAPESADIVVSRNMLHRLVSLEEGLLRMIRAAKPNGGMIFTTSFRRVSDLDKAGQLRFAQNVQERQGFPKLQEAYILAHLNAPTLAEYEQSARQVAKIIEAEDMWVQPGLNNEVNIYIHR